MNSMVGDGNSLKWTSSNTSFGPHACAVSYDIIEDLDGKNITEEIQDEWPCELLEFWNDFKPFVHFVQGLLHQGTIVIIIVGLVCNCLSVCVLSQKTMRKSSTNMYLAVLAVYDMLALIMNFMIGVLRGQYINVNKDFQASEHLCKAQAVFVEVFNLLSVWIIVAFTVERYILVIYPLKSKLNTFNRSRLVIFGVSLVVIVFSLHKIFISGFEGDSVFGYKACRTRRKTYKEAVYFYVAFNTWLPTLIIFALNIRMLVQLKRNSKKRAQLTNKNVKFKGDDKATRLLLTVSCVYLFLITPLGITQTIELMYNATSRVPPGDPDYVSYMIGKFRLKWSRAFFFFFYQINFAINFFLYVGTVAGERFRDALRALCGLKHGPLDETIVVSVMPGTAGTNVTAKTRGEVSTQLKEAQTEEKEDDDVVATNSVHPLKAHSFQASQKHSV